MAAGPTAAWLAQQADADVTQRPNVVVILADDMGFSDIGCYGGEIRTPNLDRLADHGLRFRNAYNGARCCPTRASLLTGLYAHQTGIGHMTNEANRRFDKGFPAYRGELNRRCVTIAEALRPAGYHTWMAGKWHVGTEQGLWPLDRGFERYYGIVRGACNYFKPGKDKLLTEGNTPVAAVDDDFYTTDAFTDHAIRFVREQQDDAPFFLYLAYNAPHWPLHAWPKDIDRYRGKYGMGWDKLRDERHARQIAMGLVDEQWPLTSRDPKVPAWDEAPAKRKEELELRMAIYAAQIDSLDQNVGRLLDTLEATGKLDTTLILFVVDNGGCAEGGNWGGGPAAQLCTKEGYMLSYGRGWANASNTPFRRYKHWVHEGGIATPLIAHWPAAIPAGAQGRYADPIVHVIDFMTTCVDLAGAQYPEECGGQAIQPMEGPALRGEDMPERTPLFWEHEGNRAVRHGKWKLTAARARGDGQWQLYDMEADRTETNDLVESHPDKARKLAALYDAWAERCGVMPWDKAKP